MVQDATDKTYGTDDNMPVVFTSRLMALAFGLDAKKDAAMDRNTIRSEKLEKKAKSGG
jgi:heterodisulfide reductase subunit B